MVGHMLLSFDMFSVLAYFRDWNNGSCRPDSASDNAQLRNMFHGSHENE